MGNYFLKKYEPINWKDDGIVILNKIGNNLTSRFDSMNFKIINDIDGLRIEITQAGNYCVLWWSFNEEELVAQLETSGGIPVKDMDAVEFEIQKQGLVKDSKNNNNKDMKNLKTFENWKNDKAEMEMRKSGDEIMKKAADEKESKKDDKCDCEKCDKEDCKCGTDCDCDCKGKDKTSNED